ncbi:MAG: GumC family protein [Polyangiales bacterium]
MSVPSHSPALVPPPVLPEEPASEWMLTGPAFVQILRKHAALIAACFVAVTTATVFWTMGQSRIYRAEAMLRLDAEPPHVLGRGFDVLTSSNNMFNHREFFETEFRVMRSMRVASTVVRQLGLNGDPGFLGVPPAARPSFKPIPIDDAALALIGRVSIEAVKDSSLVQLRYEDTDPKRCQAILATLTRVYLAQNLESANGLSTSALEWLNRQLDTLRVDLEHSEAAINDFRTKNNVLSVSLEDRTSMLTGGLESVGRRIDELEITRTTLANRNAELAKVSGDDPEEISGTELVSDVLLSTLRSGYLEQSRVVDELLSTFGDNHPKVVAARARLAKTAKSIKAEVESVKKTYLGEQRSVERDISDLKKRDEDLQKQAHDLQTLAMPYNQLNRTRLNNEKVYGMVLERARETDMTRVMSFNNIKVIDEAQLPRSPIRPNYSSNFSMGVAGGLLLGVLMGLLREMGDRTVKTPPDVEASLGVACLGLVPHTGAKTNVAGRGRRGRKTVNPAEMNPDLIVSERPDSGVAEAVRAIRTNLNFMSPDHPYRAFLVTSAVPEEGKTTVACSLAIVLAQSGLRVLLVDTDLRRPRLQRTFRVSNDVGVTLAVTGEAEIEECVQATPIPNLSVLTSGPVPPNPSEMLQSERFRSLAAKLIAQYDRVVFDSPPILPVTDAAIMSRVVDGVILVTRGFRTQKAVARQAIRQLVDVKAHVIGVVLNAVDLTRTEYRGHYYYYYKREGYYSRRAA